jgi:MarR-like DNA-binding transcriptional regulator SgrR of sgrS sRNA
MDIPTRLIRIVLIGAGSLVALTLALAQPDKKADAPKAKPVSPAGTLRPADLKLEAEQTKEPAIRGMYERLATPHDIVYWGDSNRTSRVDPVHRFVDATTDFKEKLKIVPLDEKGKRRPATTATRSEIKRIEPYEEIAAAEARSLLDPKGPAKGVPRLEVLKATERALSVVYRFHQDSRTDGRREGEAWSAVGRRLEEQLLQVQADTLRAFADNDDWDHAYEMTERLLRSYQRPDVHARLADAMALFLDRSLKAEKYPEVYERKKLLEEVFKDRDALAGPVNKSLARKGAELFQRAKQEKDQGKIITLLTTAENLYPELEGLREFRAKFTAANPILFVGVAALPERMSPATATLDAERWATDLVFESLIRPVHEPGIGERYVSVLSEGRPTLLPLGREFSLARDAVWSDGKRVAGTDVRATVSLLRQQGGAAMIDDARLGGDPYHIRLMLRQGFIDPLALMSFKVLPESARLERADDDNFARKPVGSGPFVFERRDKETVIFTVNPHYRRDGKAPNLREVRFFVSKAPADDFKLGRLHLLLDPDGVAKVHKANRVATHLVPNRRIHFLAVNHRHAKLQNENLRLALARAINRTKILDEVFRAGWPDKPHRALHGPYLPGCWACPEGNSIDLYNLSAAKALASEMSKRGGNIKLSLKYPEGDAAVARACDLMRIQAAEAGIELRLEPRSVVQLRNDVEMTHDYELAYYHWDYTSDAYLLWPLFDPKATGKGGSNFMGYQPDAELQEWFRKALDHRDFTLVKQYTHTVHGILQMKMPLIPLWQLDTPIAVHESLRLPREPGRMDGLGIFADVDRWQVK